jgi:predicted tellurium resistance membrane protein TerC
LISLIEYFQNPILSLPFSGVVEGHFNIHSLIVLGGGIFIVYTAMKEIWHMIGVSDVDHNVEGTKKSSVSKVIIMIVLMNVVFSFDSILSAMALTEVFWIMAVAIITGGLLMIWLADKVSDFLERNRMYEVLGLFILFIVGIMLITEGGHLAHLKLLDNEITPMSKTTFYFVIAILVITDIVQSKYQKKLLEEKEHDRMDEN